MRAVPGAGVAAGVIFGIAAQELGFIVGALCVATLLSFVLTPVAIRFAHRAGAIDEPDSRRRVHRLADPARRRAGDRGGVHRRRNRRDDGQQHQPERAAGHHQRADAGRAVLRGRARGRLRLRRRSLADPGALAGPLAGDPGGHHDRGRRGHHVHLQPAGLPRRQVRRGRAPVRDTDRSGHRLEPRYLRQPWLSARCRHQHDLDRGHDQQHQLHRRPRRPEHGIALIASLALGLLSIWQEQPLVGLLCAVLAGRSPASCPGTSTRRGSSPARPG